jgi:ABC-type Fe3+-hydroxamate transport system substrate-binding protein
MSLKIRFGILLAVSFLLLSACSSNSTDTAGSESLSEPGQVEVSLDGDKVKLTNDYADDAVSIPTQLVVGSLLLEEAELALDAEMAEKLLPYWKMYKVLAESDTKAPEEMDAVIDQIQEIMTADQVNYINYVDPGK